MTMKTSAAVAAIAAALLTACAPRQLAYPVFPAETTSQRNVDFDEGYAWSRGLGVPRDYARALSSYRKAADAGDARAMNNIGVMALQGRGLGPSSSEASSWFEKAIGGGSAAASYNLGLMNEFAVASFSSMSEATRYYGMASAQGHGLAQRRLADMTGADAAESRRLTEMAALSGDVEAIGRIRQGAARGSRDQQSIIALLAEEHCPDCTKSDKDVASSAMKNLHALAETGDAPALYDLGVRYLKGDGIVKDPSKAVRYFSRAAKTGYAPAALQLARMHSRGETVAYSQIIAHSLFNLAARDTGSVGDAARSEMDALEATMSQSDVEKAQNLASRRAASGQ